MRMSLSCFLLGACLFVPSVTGYAGQAAEGQAAPAPAQAATPAPAAPAKAASPSTSRSDAAEGRYRTWVEQEHAKDAATFTKEKSKIEDKYKGYVRPKREKKDGKAEPAPAKP